MKKLTAIFILSSTLLQSVNLLGETKKLKQTIEERNVELERENATLQERLKNYRYISYLAGSLGAVTVGVVGFLIGGSISKNND